MTERSEVCFTDVSRSVVYGHMCVCMVVTWNTVGVFLQDDREDDGVSCMSVASAMGLCVVSRIGVNLH